MRKFAALIIAVAYFSAVNGTYLNSLTAADGILAKVNGDYTPRKVYFPDIYSNDKVWNADHTSYRITQEVNCVNGSIYFTGFQRTGYPEMDGDTSNTYLKFTVVVGKLQVGYSVCDGITYEAPGLPTTAPPKTTTTKAPTVKPKSKLAVFAANAPQVLVGAAATTAKPAPATPAKPAATTAAPTTTTPAPTTTTPAPPQHPNAEVHMRNTFPYTTQLVITIGIKSNSESCTSWVVSIQPDSFSWNAQDYWNDVFDQIQTNMRSTFQYEMQPIFSSALSETDICYLLN